MARAKKKAKAKRPVGSGDSDAPARHRMRLIRWAELINRVEDLDDAIEAAWQDDIIDEDSKDESREALLEVYDLLRGAVPTRRSL